MATETDGWSPFDDHNFVERVVPAQDRDAEQKQSESGSGEGVIGTMELTAEDQAALDAKAHEEKLDNIRALDSVALEKLLKRRMAAVLKAHKHLQTVDTAAANSLTSDEVAMSQSESELRLPVTSDKNVVRETLEAFEKVEERRIEVQRANFNWTTKSEWARHERNVATTDLRQTVELVAEALPDFTSDALFVAALHMSDKFQRVEPVAPVNHPDQHELLDTFDMTIPQHEARNALRDATFEAAVQLSAALKLGNQFGQAANYIAKRSEPSVRTPVRPSEEEVQRYLIEIEQFMIEKQRGGRDVLELKTKCDAMAKELARHQAVLTAAVETLVDLTTKQTAALELKLADGSRRPAWLLKCVAVSNAVSNEISRVLSWYESFNAGQHDEEDVVTVSKTEKRDMEVTRAQARLLGFAIGRYNEARSNKSAAERVKIPEIKLSDVAEGAKTWEECLDWRARKHKEQFESSRLQLSKDTKLELLQETVEAAIEEVDETSASLQRTIRAAMAVGYDRPCNDLRALYNACAWYCKDGESSTKTKSKLLFPVFPLKKENEA